MPATTAPSSEPELNPPPEKLSAFVARVLDQLALSAWLPAAFLAASVAVLYRLGVQDNLNVADATSTLVKNPVTLLVITVPIVVLTTLVTQSFSFEAIRALEGYWQRRWLLGGLHHLLVTAKARRKATLTRRLPDAQDEAFNSARGPMLRAKRSQAVVDAIEADLNNIRRDDLPEADERVRKNTNWREFGDPSAVARYDRIRTLLADYPPNGLVMPTQLGNVLRSTEARLKHAGGDVSSFALRRRRLADSRTQLQHDQFRTRLDMYCTLVFVALFLAAISPWLLRDVPHGQPYDLIRWLVPPGLFLALAFASYRASVASARGYCSILRVMDDPALDQN